MIPLWTAPEPGPGPAVGSFVKHQEIAHNWQLAPLKLPVGTVITFHAEAIDFDTIKGPKLGKSREIRLRIVSKEDAARQFDDGRRELREELARVLTMQKQAIAPVDNAIRSLKETPGLPQAQRDDLNNAGMIQRQVGGRLNNRDDGVGARLRRIAGRPQELQARQRRRPEADGGHAGPAERDSRPAPGPRRARDLPGVQEPGRRRRQAGRAEPETAPGRSRRPARPEARRAEQEREARIRRRAAKRIAEPRRMQAARQTQTGETRRATPVDDGRRGDQAKPAGSGQAKAGGEATRPKEASPRAISRRSGKASTASSRPSKSPSQPLPPASRKSPAPSRRRGSWPRPRRIRRRSPTSCRRCSMA